MKINTIFKAFIAIALFAITIAVASQNTEAYNPYGYENTIGTMYQWQYNYGYYGDWPETYRTRTGVYNPNVWHYDYLTPPRAGGFFGTGTSFLTGLRKPYYPYVYPSHYTSFSRPYCSWPCTFGGYWGYPNYGAEPSSYTYRVRYGFY